MVKEKLSMNNKPYLCTPIVSKEKENLLKEAKRVIEKKPDIIEWRVDYFEEIDDFKKVMEAAKDIKKIIGCLPLLFTVRSEKEGGNPINLTNHQVSELVSLACECEDIDIVDYEIHNPEENIVKIKKATEQNNKLLILSYHNFQSTPSNADLLEILEKAEQYGADIAKIAVMPRNHADVIRLFEVTDISQHELNIPVATMSMNHIGAISRVAGWIFGSAIIFTIGEKSSAPGQIPIEDIRILIKTMKQYQQ